MSASKPAVAARRAPRARLDPLRLSQEVLRYLPSGIVFFDHEGHVQEANPSARAALGYAAPQGMTMAELFRDAVLHDADGSTLGLAGSVLAETYQNHRILQRKNLRYTTPDGLHRRLGITLFPLREGERTTGLICLLTDLTAIHALEEELQRRKNLSALGEMAAGIAHEFKNALATISGYAQMLHSGLSESDRPQTAKILEQVAMLNNIATEFLVFARPLAVQPEAVDLDRLLRECVEAVKVQSFPNIQIELEGPFPPVAGDPVLLTAAAMNLLRNSCEAIAHSGRSGQVRVVYAGTEGKSARILFTDNGPGVSPEVVERIFIPFFTTKPSGTGLGLAMVHKIVTAHQGSVLLTDASAGHTVFAVLLPAASPSRPH